MPALSHLKNIRGQLATAFGIHLVQGYTVLEDVTTPTGAEAEVIVLQALGDGHGAGWDGPQEVTYRGHAIDPSSYHFHAGTFSKGLNDTAQGIDSWFPGGITYSGTTYNVAKLPRGVASEGNSTELQGIYRCLKLPDFNSAGQQIDKDGALVPSGAAPEDYFFYSANPARVAAWLILFGRGLSKNRVDWPAWVAFRDYCDELIEWVDGTTTEIEGALDWRPGGGMTVGDSGSATKGRDTSGVNAWDSGTTSLNACPVNASNHRGFQFTINSPYGFMVGLTRATVLSGDGHTYRNLDIALYYELGGTLKVYSAGTLVGTLAGGWAGGQTYRVVDEAGAWKFYRNGVAITHSLTLPAPPSGAIYGGIACNVQNSGVSSSSFFPAAGVSSTQAPRMIPRFEAHVAFTQPTSLGDALDQVCFVACADWQETPKIRFLTPEPAVEPGAELHAAQRTIVHHFDATDANVDNIIKRTITAYPMDVRERWNFAEGIFRDLDNRDLIEDFVEDERAALQDAAGDGAPRIISPGQVNLGNMTRSQALRVLKWLMRLRSDRVWFCELRAAADSLHVLPGDVVRVSHATYNWVEKLFLVIDATDDEEGADERSFILQEYDPANYYSDADHSRGQVSTAPPVPSPFQPPPPVEDVQLEETLTPQADGTILSGIRGTVNFIGYAGKQFGRVWWKPSSAPSSAWAPAGVSLLKPQPDTGQDVFEIRGVEKIDYDIVVVSEAENTTQLPFTAHDVYSVTILGKQAAPAQPVGLSATMGENGMVVFSVNPSTEPDFSFMRVYDGTGAIVRSREPATKWEEPPNTSTITRKVTYFNTSGRESVFSATYTFTLPSPVAPAGSSASRDNANIVLKWTAIEGLDYQVSLDQSAILWQGKGGQYRVLSAITGAGTYTYYVRSMRFNVASAWVAVPLVVAAPAGPAGATLVRDKQALVMTWTVVAGQEYQVSTDQATVLWSGRSGVYRRESVVNAAGTYTYYVRTLQDGVMSAWSAAAVVVTAPAAPTGAALTRDRQALHLGWTALEGFDYEVSPDQVASYWKGRAASYRREGVVTAAATYTYWVRAIDNGITGAWVSASVIVTAPIAPSGATLIRDRQAIFLGWTAVEGFDYEVSLDQIATLWKGRAAGYRREGVVTAAATYTYSVRAIDNGIAGAWVSASVVVSAPASVTGFSLTRLGRAFIGKWTMLPGFEYEYSLDGTSGIWRGGAGEYTETGVPAAAGTYTRYVRAIDNGIVGPWVSTTVTISAPAPPTSATGTFDGAHVQWKLGASSSVEAITYRAKTTAGVLIGDDIGLDWKQKVTSGTSVYAVRFFSVDTLGIESTTYTETTFTVPAPGAPTLALSIAPEQITHNVTAPATLPDGLQYDLARANDGTNIINRVSNLVYFESLLAQSPSARLFTRYARSVNAAGLTSGWASATTTYQPITAAPTLTADTARALPSSLPVAVVTATSRAYVRHIVVQVRASGGAWPANVNDGTSGVYRFSGDDKTINVPWTAGGAMEYRVALEDVLTQSLSDHIWTATQSFTFPYFSEGALDPNSNFLKKANWRDPIYTGGGTFTWTTDFKIKWDQPIIITGLGSLISSTGQVSIAANTAGTTLAAGQMLLAVQTAYGTTLSLLVAADDGTYTPPADTSTTIHRRLFKRNSDNTLSTYLGVPIPHDGVTNYIMDSRVLIPMLSSFDAILFNATITNANIKNLSAGKVFAEVLGGIAVFGDDIGSNNYRADYSPTSETITPTYNATTGICTRRVARGAFYHNHHQRTNTGYNFYVQNNAGQSWGWIEGGGATYYYTPETGVTYWNPSFGFSSLEIDVDASNVVRIKTAGSLVYQSTTALIGPRRLVAAGNHAVNDEQVLTGILEDYPGAKCKWGAPVGITFDSLDDIQGTGATGVWGACGAFAAQGLDASAEAALEVTVDSITSVKRAIGLSLTNAGYSDTNIKYGLVLDGSSLKVVENGAYVNSGASVATIAVNDILRIERGATQIKVYKGATLAWTFATYTASLLYPHAAFFTANSYLKGVRLFKTGIVQGSGWRANKTGSGDFTKDVKVAGNTFDKISARAVFANDANLQYRGNDFSFPRVDKVSAASVYKWKYELQNPWANDIGAQLKITLPDPGSNVLANMDSIKRVWIKVIDRFGSVVTDIPPMQFPPGGGLTPWFWHPLKYAHPNDDATYEVRLENAYGWSQPFYLARGVFQQAAPTYFNKRDCPLELMTASEMGSSLAWMPAQQNASSQTVQYRELGSTSWLTNASGLSSTSDNAVPSSVYLGMWYEFRVLNTGVAGAYSNVVASRVGTQVRHFSVHDTTTGNQFARFPAPENITARPVSQTTNRVRWSGITTGANLPTDYRIYRDGTLLATIGAPASSYDDTTASAGATYIYHLQAGFAAIGGAGVTWSDFTNAAVVRTATTLNATDPTNLTARGVSSSRIDLSWLLNGNTGAVSIEFKSYDPYVTDHSASGFWSSGVTTIAQSAGVVAYSHIGLLQETRYAYRVKAGSSNYTNVATADTMPSSTVYD